MQSIDASVIEAIELAARQHQGQFRKGKRKAAYINHPIQLMGVLIRHQENDSDLLKAAALHDVIEDTAKTREEIEGLSQTIESKFGKEVLKVVREVSDDKNLPFPERKRLQIVNTPKLSQHAKKIKIADKTCNIIDMMDDPPSNWSTDRKLEYLRWAEQVIEGARGVNPALEDYFDQTRKQAYRHYTRDNTE